MKSCFRPLAFSLLTACALGLIPARAADWPQWRGPNRTGHADGAQEPESLPAELTPQWKVPVGGGHSGPVLAGGRLVYLDENGSREIVHVLDAKSGKEIWQLDYADVFRDEWGAGPRATPIIDGERLYVQSCNGEFRCLNLADGKLIWGTSFETDFGVKFLGSKANEGTATRRGNNGSGVIDGNRIILPVGSTKGASLVAFDKVNGKAHWRSGNDEAAYSSFMSATIAGVRQVVAFTADALLGAELATGKILWRVPLRTNAKRHAASPVILGDRVLVNSHTIGLVCFQVSREGEEWKATQAWANKQLLINLATPVAVDGHLYSQGPRGDYVCVDAKTGETKWSQAGFGGKKEDYASTIAVGNKLLVLTEGGQLILLAANPEKYTELGRSQVCGNTWSFPAYADGKLYVRDRRQLSCFDLAGR